MSLPKPSTPLLQQDPTFQPEGTVCRSGVARQLGRVALWTSAASDECEGGAGADRGLADSSLSSNAQAAWPFGGPRPDRSLRRNPAARERLDDIAALRTAKVWAPRSVGPPGASVCRGAACRFRSGARPIG